MCIMSVEMHMHMYVYLQNVHKINIHRYMYLATNIQFVMTCQRQDLYNVAVHKYL